MKLDLFGDEFAKVVWRIFAVSYFFFAKAREVAFTPNPSHIQHLLCPMELNTILLFSLCHADGTSNGFIPFVLYQDLC